MILKLLTIFEKGQLEFSPEKIAEYSQNVCGATRNILGIIYPKSESEIKKLIQLNHELNIPLYPISKGTNYGLGSRLPVTDNHLIIDMSRMNHIIGFDSELGVIQIEPGVTQQAVANFLKERNADFILNTTGSSAESSLVGNALERGIGHYGSRVPEVINLDIILGSGEKLVTNVLNMNYSYGLGPDIKGLFFQSNFGIVTAMTLRLLPKTQSVAIITLEKNSDTPLDIFIEQLRLLKNKQLLPENLHISNFLRRMSIISPLIAKQMNISIVEAKLIAKKYVHSDWAATASLRGEKKIIEAQFECLKSFIYPYANLSILFDEEITQFKDPYWLSLQGVLGHALGYPSSDALLSLGYSLQEKLSDRLEKSNIGTLFLIPVIPFKGQDVLLAMHCIEEIFQLYQFDAYVTWNLVEHINLEGVINLTFLKTDEQAVKTAHSCIHTCLEKLECLGYPPMRLSIFQQTAFLYKDDTFKNIRAQLKNMFDPYHFIAQDRY